MPVILPRSFYKQDDVVAIARQLLGKVLCTYFDNKLTTGIISETEAYNGRCDKACHAYPDVRTQRTEIMYGEPGRAYIYLCYGIHHLFNVVTNKEERADAVLIRSIKPLKGIKEMHKRRNMQMHKPILVNGPGKLSQALGITTDYSGIPLNGKQIWIEDHDIEIPQKHIVATPRIGVDYADEDAKLPWRFTPATEDLKEWVSR